jgi:hypothetical protein
MLAAAVAVVLIALPSGKAEAAAFCAYGGGGRSGAYENCGYYTFEQCLAAISGVGGFCQLNPHNPRYWGAGPPPPRSKKYRRAG